MLNMWDVSATFGTLKPAGSAERPVQLSNIQAAPVTFGTLKPAGSSFRLEQYENMLDALLTGPKSTEHLERVSHPLKKYARSFAFVSVFGSSAGLYSESALPPDLEGPVGGECAACAA